MEKAPAVSTDFGDRLNKLLEEKGITKTADFARAISRSKMVTLGWRRGKVPRSPDDWKVLCEFFDCTADHLLLGKERHEPMKITLEIPIHDPNCVLAKLHPEKKGDGRAIAIDGLLMGLHYVAQKILDKR